MSMRMSHVLFVGALAVVPLHGVVAGSAASPPGPQIIGSGTIQAAAKPPARILTMKTISGSPLVINVGDDLSFQVYNSNVGTGGQIYPPSCALADMGVMIRSNGTLYAPNFHINCSSSAFSAPPNTPWTPVSISGPTGIGTDYSPYTITAIAQGGGLTVTLKVHYVQGDQFFNEDILVANVSGGTVSTKVFLASDIYLKSDDNGKPIKENSSVGGQHGDHTCKGDDYKILHIPLSPASHYAAKLYSDVWDDIRTGDLGDNVATGCIDDGAGLEWLRSIDNGMSTQIYAVTSFGKSPNPACIDPCLRTSGPMSVAYIPNAFTPNGDGLNDVWCVSGIINVAILDVYIFNRWGQLIFQNTYMPAHDHGVVCSWDGRYQGSLVKNDVYVFRLVAQNCGSDSLITLGKVTVVK